MEKSAGWRGLLESRRLFLFACGCVLAAHLLAGAWIAVGKTDFFLHNDGEDYADLAASFSKGEGFTVERLRWFEPPRDKAIPEAYRPLLLSFLGSLFLHPEIHEYAQLSILQALLFTLLSAIVFKLALKLGNSVLCAWLSFALLNLHPLLVQYSFQFCTETLFSLLLASFSWCMLMREGRGWKYALAGLAAAAASMARPTALLLGPLTVAALLLLPGGGWRRKVKRALLFGAVFSVCVLPGALRNKLLFGEMKFSSFFGGYNFFIGNNAENLRAYMAEDGREFIRLQDAGWERGAALTAAMPPELRGNPPAQDRHWRKLAFEEIKEMGPANFMRLQASKAWHFIRPWPLKGPHGDLQFWAVSIFELLLYGAGLYGVLRLRHKRMRLPPFALVFLCGLIAHTMVHVMLRHRTPFVDVSLVIFAGLGLKSLSESLLSGLRAAHRTSPDS